MSRLGPLLVVLLALLPAAALAADEDPEAAAARAYARERLLGEARQALAGSGKGPDPFEAMQKSLAADHALLMGYQPKTDDERRLLEEFEKTISERILLIGWQGDGNGEGAAPGALQESQLLDGWLAGKVQCSVLVAEEGAPPGKERAFLYPPPAPEPPPPPPPPPPSEGALESPPPGPAPGGEPAEPAPEKPPGEVTAAPVEPKASAAEPKTAPPAAPTEPPSVDEWAKTVRDQLGGSLRGKVLTPAECGVVPSLLKAAGQPPAYKHPDVDGIERHAVVAKNVFGYNAPFAAMRLLQADERNKAMQQDQPPPSLVDESLVRQKARVVERYREVVANRQAQRQRVLDDLDRMVFALDAWKTQAALLARDIEGLKQAVAASGPGEGEDGEDEDPDAGDPPEGAHGPDAVVSGPAALALRLAEARESLVSMEITLLYMTAARAERRLALLDRLLKAATEEMTAAEQVLARYEAALRKLRSARRLDRLNSDERLLMRWIAPLESRTLPEGSIYRKRLAAYRAVLEVNRAVQDAVIRRRNMAAGTEPDPLPKPKEGGADTPGSKTDAAEGADRLTGFLMEPQSATWDVKLVQIASRELLDPELEDEFTPQLIAAHYAAVDDQIRATLSALQTQKEEDRLRERFDAAKGAADAALASLQDDPFTMRDRRLPALLAAAVEDFEAAMAGIAEERKQNRARLEALMGYRELLLSQGMRSLLIRTDRDLSDENIRNAFRDTSHAVGVATRWATFRGDENASGFLGREWWRVLLLAAVVVGVVLLVRLSRRRVDRWIERSAAAHPALRLEGASVREEHQEAKRRREEEQQAAVAATEEEILKKEAPSPEPEAEPQAEAEPDAGAPAEVDEDAKEKGR